MAYSLPLNHHNLHSRQHSLYRSRRTRKSYTALFRRNVLLTVSSLRWCSQFLTDQRKRKISSEPPNTPPPIHSHTVTVLGRYNLDGMVSRLWAVNQGIVVRFSAGDKRFSLYSKRAEGLWRRPILLPNGYRQLHSRQ